MLLPIHIAAGGLAIVLGRRGPPSRQAAFWTNQVRKSPLTSASSHPQGNVSFPSERESDEKRHAPHTDLGVSRISTQHCVEFLHNDPEAAASGRPPARPA
jgi:hypothetical protein